MDRQAQTQQARAGNEQRDGQDGPPQRWWHFARLWRLWYLAAICVLATMAQDGLVFWGGMGSPLLICVTAGPRVHAMLHHVRSLMGVVMLGVCTHTYQRGHGAWHVCVSSRMHRCIASACVLAGQPIQFHRDRQGIHAEASQRSQSVHVKI